MWNINYRSLSDLEKIEKILKRSKNRTDFYERLIKFVAVCLAKKIRMVFENPYSTMSFLINNFLDKPKIIDKNRMERGDFFVKPTAYWFWNCEPTYGCTIQNDKKQKIIRKTKFAPQEGICSEERSLISSDYARNWICDFIIGKSQPDVCPTLF